MATSTVEDYLKVILLEEEASPGTLVTTGRIATALRVVPGTATSMVKALADGGLVRYEPYSGVALTDEGRRLATRVLRRHRLVELFLVQVMGMDWSEVHAEAEELEHVVSERLLERMDEMLGHPSVDPHGDPIPDSEGRLDEAPALVSLAEVAEGTPVRVARVLDQEPEFLRLVERRGLMPGRRLTARQRDEAADTVDVVLEPDEEGGANRPGPGAVGDAEPLSLGLRAASKILVEPLS